MDSKRLTWRVLEIIALAAVGFLLIPPLMKKYSIKLYKGSLKKDKIDYDNLGPEIIRTDDAQRRNMRGN